jgi:hypothetical protein
MTTKCYGRDLETVPDAYGRRDAYRAAQYFGPQGELKPVAWKVVWNAGGGIQYMESSPQGLDLKKTEQDLQQYASSQGVDLDALLLAASTHFENDVIVRRTAPFSAAELAELVEDDNQHARDMP